MTDGDRTLGPVLAIKRGPRSRAEVEEVVEWLYTILATHSGFDYVDGPAPEEIERKLLDAKTPFEIIQVAGLVGE